MPCTPGDSAVEEELISGEELGLGLLALLSAIALISGIARKADADGLVLQNEGTRTAGVMLIGLILFYSMEFLDDRIVFWRRESRRASMSRAKARRWKARMGK